MCVANLPSSYEFHAHEHNGNRTLMGKHAAHSAIAFVLRIVLKLFRISYQVLFIFWKILLSSEFAHFRVRILKRYLTNFEKHTKQITHGSPAVRLHCLAPITIQHDRGKRFGVLVSNKRKMSKQCDQAEGKAIYIGITRRINRRN